jgi:hypothetical protein
LPFKNTPPFSPQGAYIFGTILKFKAIISLAASTSLRNEDSVFFFCEVGSEYFVRNFSNYDAVDMFLKTEQAQKSSALKLGLRSLVQQNPILFNFMLDRVAIAQQQFSVATSFGRKNLIR